MTILTGHTSPETAYLVNDYPYGFRLRCKIRYWIETKPRYGMRLMSQTTNPKRPGEVWNKPKGGGYAPLLLLTINPENGHVGTTGVGFYTEEDKFLAWVEAHAAYLTGDYMTKTVNRIKIGHKVAKHITYKVVRPGEPTQSKDEKDATVAKLFSYYAHELGVTPAEVL